MFLLGGVFIFWNASFFAYFYILFHMFSINNFFTPFGNIILNKGLHLLLYIKSNTNINLFEGISIFRQSNVLHVVGPLLIWEDISVLIRTCFFLYKWISCSYFFIKLLFLMQLLQATVESDSLCLSIMVSAVIYKYI